jgi:hypothetical protein
LKNDSPGFEFHPQILRDWFLESFLASQAESG